MFCIVLEDTFLIVLRSILFLSLFSFLKNKTHFMVSFSLDLFGLMIYVHCRKQETGVLLMSFEIEWDYCI